MKLLIQELLPCKSDRSRIRYLHVLSLVFGISFLPASDSLASLLYFAFVLTDSVPWATPIFNVGHVVDSAQLTIKQITAS
ncbi:hypothetical protein LOB46_10955, partial [Lactobacillus delbrueckii subsp. lactis]